jgi:hypothetical protein
LQNEFEFLKNKYKLKELDPCLWKFLRLRPANFPTVRLWQFAMLIHRCPDLFSRPESFNSTEKLETAISSAHEGYWRTHYRFDSKEFDPVNALGRNSVENLIINTIAPYLFFYGKQCGRDELMEASLECFETVPFELNHKTRCFTNSGLKFRTAGESQALINLYDNYCKTRSCLKCSIASTLLTNR